MLTLNTKFGAAEGNVVSFVSKYLAHQIFYLIKVNRFYLYEMIIYPVFNVPVMRRINHIFKFIFPAYSLLMVRDVYLNLLCQI